MACFYSAHYRTSLQQKYLLPKRPCNDCCVYFFCHPCTLCQEGREFKLRGWDTTLSMSKSQATTSFEMIECNKMHSTKAVHYFLCFIRTIMPTKKRPQSSTGNPGATDSFCFVKHTPQSIGATSLRPFSQCSQMTLANLPQVMKAISTSFRLWAWLPPTAQLLWKGEKKPLENCKERSQDMDGQRRKHNV